jgi:hypothetical protein
MEAAMTQPDRQHAQVIALDEYRRARQHDDKPRPPSFPQAAWPPPPPEIVTVIAAGSRTPILATSGG